MQISIDGGNTYVDCDNVRIIYKQDDQELHIKLCPDAVIYDVWGDVSDDGKDLDGTKEETVSEIIDRVLF